MSGTHIRQRSAYFLQFNGPFWRRRVLAHFVHQNTCFTLLYHTKRSERYLLPKRYLVLFLRRKSRCGSAIFSASSKFSGCKSCFKAKEKAVRPKRGLLVGVAIFCLVDIGEGRLFDVANEAIDNIHLEEVGMKVRQFNVVVRHYPPYKSSTSFPPCIFRLTELTDRSFLYLYLLLEE